MRHWRRSCPELRQMPPLTRWRQSPRDLPWGARAPARKEESALWRSSQVHLRFDIHPRAKLAVPIFTWIENDFYGDALNDFHVVAGCVFGWQQAEDGSRCSGNAVDMTVVRAAVRVEVNRRFLAYAHVFELGLFEIRGDPYLIQRNHSEELFAGVDIQPDDNLLRDFAGYRRQYSGVSQIQLRLFYGGSFLVYIGPGRKRFC